MDQQKTLSKHQNTEEEQWSVVGTADIKIYYSDQDSMVLL